MTKIGNKMRVSFQYVDPITEKKVSHNFSDVAPNATVEEIRLVKDAIDAVSAQESDTVAITENYQVFV